MKDIRYNNIKRDKVGLNFFIFETNHFSYSIWDQRWYMTNKTKKATNIIKKKILKINFEF